MSCGNFPAQDEGWTYSAGLEAARVFFKGERVVLALLEGSDF